MGASAAPAVQMAKSGISKVGTAFSPYGRAQLDTLTSKRIEIVVVVSQGALRQTALRQVHYPRSDVPLRHRNRQTLEHGFPVVKLQIHILNVTLQLIGAEVFRLDVAEL